MIPESFTIVGRFPLGISCNVISNIAVIYENRIVRINSELDSPTFLFKHKDGFFIQVASQTNGAVVLVHENDVELFDDAGNAVDLYEIKVQPLGDTNG